MVGGILKECVVKEQCLLVVCHALDSIFDIFGDDACPVELFTSLDLLPVLMECRASFNARVRQAIISNGASMLSCLLHVWFDCSTRWKENNFNLN